MFDSLKKAADDIEAAQEKAAKLVKDVAIPAFKEAFSELFAAHPDLVAVRWEQYTPYFNDGEPCHFGVNSPYVKMKDTEEDAGDYEDGFEYVSTWSLEDKPESLRNAYKAVDELFKLLDNDTAEAAFGDHSQITATRDGFTVDECNHD